MSLAIVFFVCVCGGESMYVHMHAEAQGQQEKAPDPLELVLEQVMCCQPMLRTELRSLREQYLLFATESSSESGDRFLFRKGKFVTG